MDKAIYAKVPCGIEGLSNGLWQLRFDDLNQLNNTISALENLKKAIVNGEKNRLEFFDDGIYLDGEALDLRGNSERILRLFEHTDVVSELELAERVWGDSSKSAKTISSAVYLLNKKLIKTEIYVEKIGYTYRILRPLKK